jgi:hypothetical protein
MEEDKKQYKITKEGKYKNYKKANQVTHQEILMVKL